jgi:hypothetical protein
LRQRLRASVADLIPNQVQYHVLHLKMNELGSRRGAIFFEKIGQN